MKQQTGSLPAVGGSSLLAIFAVLCLTVLGLLSLTTVQAEARLAQASHQAVMDHYAAELKAEEVFARLRGGETVSGVMVTDGVYSYRVPISAHQSLAVALKREGDTWTILLWQTEAHPEQIDEQLPVWTGAG